MVCIFLQSLFIINLYFIQLVPIFKGFCEDFHTIQQRKHFKLIADSVESLRAFIYELDMKGTSVPESLISSLNNFIVNIEPKEHNYIVMNNDSKIKLFKDWVSYSDRIKKDEDNISVWEEKDSKSISKSNVYFMF